MTKQQLQKDVSKVVVPNSEDGALMNEQIATEFRKLDIIVRDSEYVAGTDNHTTIIVRNTYPKSIKIGTVRARHSSLVTAEQNQTELHVVNTKVERNTRFAFRLPSWNDLFFPFSSKSYEENKPVIDFSYQRKTNNREPINIAADGASTIDLNTADLTNRGINVTLSDKAQVKILDSNPEKDAQDGRSDISPTSEIITGFTWSTRSWLLFIPSRVGIDIEVPYEIEGQVRSQVVSTNFEIKPPILSIIVGGVFGSLIGSAARSFISSQVQFDLHFGVRLAGSSLLAIMAVVALSRKSGSQAFITVEDFFGAFVLGSLIGYGGTSFFETRVLPGISGSE